MHTLDDDRWLWYIDDAPLQALLRAESGIGTMKMRAASSPALVRAVAAHLEGHTAEALAGLREAIGAGDRQPEEFVFLGQLEFEAGDYENAAATFAKLAAMDPGHGTAAFNRAVCLEKLSRWSEAAAAFREAADDGDLPAAWLGLGLCLLHQRRPEDALAAFERFLIVEPDHESALFGQAVALQMLRRFDEAQAIYGRFQTGPGGSPELVINLLALAVAKKDTAAVAALSQELESLRPGARQAREVSAQGALAAGDWNGALRHLEQLAASEPLLEDWAYALAWCQFQAGRLRECAARLEAILEGNPTYGPAHMLAAALAEREDPASAIPHYEKAARTLARPAAAWWNLARLYAAAGDPAGSREAANALRGLNSMPAETAYASGLVSLAESNARQAVSDFREALRQRPEWPEARWNLGLALWSAGDAAAAVESFLAAFGRLSTLPREPLIAALVEQGDFAAAAAEIEELADPTGLPPQLIFNAALGLHRAGVMEQAETLYRLALESEDAMPEASVNLGHVLLASGRPGEANACWESVRG